MTTDDKNSKWPDVAGDPARLVVEIKPPADLEDKLVGALFEQGLIEPNRSAAVRRTRWFAMRASLAAAASVALVAIGVWIGAATMPAIPTGSLTGAESNLYALLLYETAGFDDDADAMSSYSEYSAWVAEARRRGQFVTGEDLEVHQGWLLAPSDSGIEIAERSSLQEHAALSGIFFIEANSPQQALDLARSLPHIKHGGSVLVQKTIRTDVPPDSLK